MDIHQFFLGNAFDAHTYFGAHVTEQGVVFRTLAPNAAAVDLIWEGGDWEPIPMQRIHDGGVYELTVPEAVAGQMYKYRITPQNPDGDIIDHCDPYGFGMELRPNNASIIRDLSSYTFHDKKWLAQRGSHRKKPVNIYEVHLGSWRTNPNDPNGWYTYEEIAPKLVDYVKKAGYNYIEFMPLSEHPADCSWGYQNTGFFSPTSRYGTAHQLMQLVDTCHQAGIGVILDFVPVHFAVDGYALNHYDGTTLYEYPEKEDNYSEWGSCNFIHARGEVCSFLQSCANYWLSVFHFDGLRMDAVSRLIYWGGDASVRNLCPDAEHRARRKAAVTWRALGGQSGHTQKIYRHSRPKRLKIYQKHLRIFGFMRIIRINPLGRGAPRQKCETYREELLLWVWVKRPLTMRTTPASAYWFAATSTSR